ncbi:hypothetical protein CONPUDRAFT_24457, partial [Coniophora puteana RWD-64-598 SS2]
MPIRDVRTRWNSTHAMMGRALILRKAINHWVFDNDKLTDLYLPPYDWEEVEMIHELLQ